MKNQKLHIVFAITLAVLFLAGAAWLSIEPQGAFAADRQSEKALSKSEDHTGHGHSESETGHKHDAAHPDDDHSAHDHSEPRDERNHDESHKDGHSGQSHGKAMEKDGKKSE